jgi:hypothetical protein
MAHVGTFVELVRAHISGFSFFVFRFSFFETKTKTRRKTKNRKTVIRWLSTFVAFEAFDPVTLYPHTSIR